MTIQDALRAAAEHHQAGRLPDAEKIYRSILIADPRHARTLHLLGMCLYSQGHPTEAIDLIRRAIQSDPTDPTYHSNLGLILAGLNQTDDAMAAYDSALRIDPKMSDAHNNRGMLLAKTGRVFEAFDDYQRAIRFRPDYAEAYNNMANAARAINEIYQAKHLYRQALRLNPNYPEAHANLAAALQTSGDLDEAERELLRALELKPNHPQAWINLGSVMQDRACLDDAIACYEKARQLDPHDPVPESNKIYATLFHPAYTAEQQLQKARDFARRHQFPLHPHPNPRTPRRLRIGYVSPDFNRHCQNFFTRPLFSHHDPEKVEIFCYSDVIAPDAVTEELRAAAHHWQDITGHTDESVSDQIRHDQIDILVDLTLHMSRNRLLVFARKPAPVQVTWLGYPGTTGLQTIDYRITDPYLDPPGTDHLYTEKSLRLPDTFWCYDPGPTPDVTPAPLLANRFVTFGCLNNYAKVTDPTLDLWTQVLDRIPNSRLILLTPPGKHRERLTRRLANRLELIERQPRQDYLALYGRIDIALDTLPYNGHTTSLDAFYMGVPVVTLIGQTVVGRAGWSQLNNLGLPQLAAHTPDQFIQIASTLPQTIAHLRPTLRDRMKQSPLMDAPRFARNIEKAYQTMWQAWISA